jgi:hypothetical protein
MRPTSVASEGDMKPGNRKGTNPGPPDRTRRTRRTALVLRPPPPVLNSTAANSGPPFGTKRPQVQILSPRLYSRRSEALTRLGEGLSAASTAVKCGQYSNEDEIDLRSEGASLSLRCASRVAIGTSIRIDLQRRLRVRGERALPTPWSASSPNGRSHLVGWHEAEGHAAVGVLTWDCETESVAEKLKDLGGTPQTHEVAALTAEDR